MQRVTLHFLQDTVSEPELVKHQVILDLDHSQCELHFWRHERYKELLCLGPTHMAKSWKKQISKLKLSAENEKHLLALIWRFALQTELCDCSELDSEWEALTRVALRMAGFTSVDDLILLPHDLRLSTKTSFEANHTESSQASVAGIQQAISFESAGDEESILLADIIRSLESIAVEADSLKCAGVSDADKLERLKAELDIVIKKICQNGVELESGTASSSSLTTLSKLQTKVCKMKDKPAKVDQIVTRELVMKAMQHIYKLSHTWCQRLVCGGHTMQRKSSTWSEILNSSIKRYVKSRNMLSGTYLLSSFVADVDQWVHELFENAYNKNKFTLGKSSHILNEVHVSLLEQVLCNGALNKLLYTLLPNAIKGEYTVSSAALPRDALCRTMNTRVGVFKKLFNIIDPEIKYLNVKPKYKLWRSCDFLEGASSSSFAEGGDDKVQNGLDQTSRIASHTLSGSTLAVYFPSAEECKIPFFSQSRPSGYGIPFFCSCQRQSSSGLPCEHMIAYILLPNEVAPRSMWNIIWLCHPAFLRCHMLASVSERM